MLKGGQGRLGESLESGGGKKRRGLARYQIELDERPLPAPARGVRPREEEKTHNLRSGGLVSNDGGAYPEATSDIRSTAAQR